MKAIAMNIMVNTLQPWMNNVIQLKIEMIIFMTPKTQTQTIRERIRATIFNIWSPQGEEKAVEAIQSLFDDIMAQCVGEDENTMGNFLDPTKLNMETYRNILRQEIRKRYEEMKGEII